MDLKTLMIPGLVSVTFRKLEASEIVGLVKEAGLQAIEWGGDVHVPHGNLERARAVRKLTQDAGLEVAAYGSYYRVWPEEPAPFEDVLETALELGAPMIRIWAGKQGSQETSPEGRKRVVEGARRIAERAGQAGVMVAFEYHGGTLTDTSQSTVQLLQEIDHPNLGCYWQPPTRLPPQERLRGLEAILPWLCNLHVFQWEAGARDTIRLPLINGETEWPGYFSTAARAERRHYTLMEFVLNDDPLRFLADVRTMLAFLDQASGAH